jgi:homoserine dehydrogenase
MRADLALVGFGNVGRRFVTLLAERRTCLQRDYDLDCRIVGISTRRHRAAFSTGGLDVAAAFDCVSAGRLLPDGDRPVNTAADVIDALGTSDAPLRVLIETTPLTIADGQPAIAHIEAAIDAGCHAITANKGPAAFAYRQLSERARAAGVSFLFEGAVMDGVPIFNLVREAMPAIAIRGFRGVVNSTTNYILSALEDGEEFAPALGAMQAAGIAEADPSLDVDGWDAAAKTAALANVLMAADLNPRGVDRTGIGPETADRARSARARGNRLRLVATASRSISGAIQATVGPVELASDDLLASLRGPANALVLHTDLLGDVAIHQLGGDLTMTAYALMSDLIALRRTAA